MLGIGLLKGLKTTLRAFFSRPVTVMYPYERMKIGNRGQGLIKLRVTSHEPVVYKCTGCGICEKNCPQRCIEVTKKEGEKQPQIYTVDYGLCMFCRICIDVCPFDALEMTQDAEHIGYSRQDFIWEKEKLAMKSLYIVEKKAPALAAENASQAGA